MAIRADNGEQHPTTGMRVVACGPVLVQGPVRIEMPDGSTVDSERPQDLEHPKRVQKQAAVPYPGSVWPATQASTWVQVRSSQGLN